MATSYCLIIPRSSDDSCPQANWNMATQIPFTNQVRRGKATPHQRLMNASGLERGMKFRLAACRPSHAAQFSRWGLERRCIPAKQPVMKPARPSSPGGGSAGDPSRLNRAAHRCVSVGIHPGQFSRWGLLPHAPCQPGVSPASSPGGGLAAHAGSTTGCSPRRCALFIVALRSKYARASCPGGAPPSRALSARRLAAIGAYAT